MEFAGNGDDGCRVTDEIPFDSERRRMSVVVECGGERWLYCKGAPEVVLGLCDRIDDGDAPAPLDDPGRRRVAAAQDAMAEAGMRVLGFAYRRLEDGRRPRRETSCCRG